MITQADLFIDNPQRLKDEGLREQEIDRRKSQTIMERYAMGEIVTKEEALSQMVLALNRSYANAMEQAITAARISCEPIIIPSHETPR